MRPIKPNARRKTLWRNVLLALLAIVLGGAGSVGGLAYFKVIDIGKLAFWRAQTKVNPIPPGSIGIPLTYRPIPAYTLITRDYLLNVKTGTPEAKWVPREEALRLVAKEGLVIDLAKIIGRVTKHELPAIHNFHEDDLLPPGTRPGISAGVPQGKRAYTFNARNLEGCVYQVKQGDHVDLIVSVPVDMPGAGRSGAMGGSVIATPDVLLRPRRTLEIPLVQDGVVVSPVTVRNSQTVSSSVMNGATTRNVRVEEIVIAVAPKEVAPLDEAKALNHKLTCIARSGLPDPAPAPDVQQPAGRTAKAEMSQVVPVSSKSPLSNDHPAADKASPSPARAKDVAPAKGAVQLKDRVALDLTPGSNPMDDVRFMEVMIGTKRQFMLFNGPGNSPVVAAQDDGSPNSAAAPGAGPAAKPADAAEESE